MFIYETIEKKQTQEVSKFYRQSIFQMTKKRNGEEKGKHTIKKERKKKKRKMLIIIQPTTGGPIKCSTTTSVHRSECE